MSMEPAKQQFFIEDVAQEVAQPLLHYLKRYVGDHTVAEDLRQETLMRMARGLPSFNGHSSIKTWAFAIASRVAADYLRHPDRKAHVVELDEVDEPADSGRDIDERLIEAQMNGCVRQVIDGLPDTYRAAVILHDLEELSVEQTAEVCECSVATAKIRIHRARRRLKEALKEQCTFYRDQDGVYCCNPKT
jgi:RNA polymerase sigma-70 factor (ECF subfamily)